MVTISRGRKTRVNISRQLEVEHRPEHEERQLRRDVHVREAGGDERVGLAAQAHQHRQEHHRRDRQDRLVPRELRRFDLRRVCCLATAASTAPRIRKTVMSTKSCSAVAEMFPSRSMNGLLARAGGRHRLCRVHYRHRWSRVRHGLRCARSVRLAACQRGQQALPYFRYWTWTTSPVTHATRKPSPTRSRDHLRRDLVVVERDPGAEDHDDVDDRPGQHVRDAARQRQPLPRAAAASPRRCRTRTSGRSARAARRSSPPAARPWAGTS